jgi:hypothetical protein
MVRVVLVDQVVVKFMLMVLEVQEVLVKVIQDQLNKDILEVIQILDLLVRVLVAVALLLLVAIILIQRLVMVVLVFR